MCIYVTTLKAINPDLLCCLLSVASIQDLFPWILQDRFPIALSILLFSLIGQIYLHTQLTPRLPPGFWKITTMKPVNEVMASPICPAYALITGTGNSNWVNSSLENDACCLFVMKNWIYNTVTSKLVIWSGYKVTKHVMCLCIKTSSNHFVWFHVCLLLKKWKCNELF